MLSACRIGVVAEVAVERDGPATAALVITLDPEAVRALDELAVDPTAELNAAASGAAAWEVTRKATEDGGLEVRLTHRANDAAAAAEALRELTSGLSERDPALLIDLELAGAEGAVELSGQAGLRPPRVAGALIDGEPVGPTPEELATATADAVDARLRVAVPGTIETHDADAVEGRTATWELPVGGMREVSLEAAPPTLLDARLAALIGAAVLASLVALWVRRRRRPAPALDGG